VSHCADWIDNTELNIALRQGAGAGDIFRTVYSAPTWTLLQLNDQVDGRKKRVGSTHNATLIERLLHLLGLQ